MKIECNHCAASYSVADEKVAGRRLKLRCKKCSEVIRVDGTDLATGAELESASPADVQMQTVAPPPPQSTEPKPADAFAGQADPFGAPEGFQTFEPPPAGPAADEPTWHISVGDTTQGPYTLQELGEYYSEGSIVLDTMVFCDGWEDWLPASEIPEIAEAAKSYRAVPAVGDQTLQRAVAMGADPFADHGDADGAAVPPAQALPQTPVESIFDAAPPPADGTVQFSLDEIKRISAISSPSMAPAAAPVGQAQPGMASGEASGLIDVAALAAMEADATDPGLENEELIGAQATPLDSLAPMALPPLSPERYGMDLRTKLLAGVGALGLVLVGGVGVLALTYSGEPDAPPAAATAYEAPATAIAAAAAPTAAPAAPAASTEQLLAAANPEAGETGATDAAEEPAGVVTAKTPKKASTGKPKRAKRSGRSAKKSIGLDDVLDKPRAKKSSGKTSIDDLLSGALSGRSKPKPEPKAKPKSDLPANPSRAQVKSALSKAKAKTKRCKGDGIALAKITVGGNGKVKSVKVSGVSGKAKSCVAKAVKSTRFPKFSKPSFQISFPFKL